MRNAEAKNATEGCLVDTDTGRQVPICDLSIQGDLFGDIEAGNQLEIKKLIVLLEN
jgi:hypothetical protein